MIVILRDVNYLGGLYYILRFSKNYEIIFNEKITIITFTNLIPKDLLNSGHEIKTFMIPKWVLKISAISGKFIGFSFIEFAILIHLKKNKAFASNIFLPSVIRKLFKITIFEWWPDFQFQDLPQNFTFLNRISRIIYYHRIRLHSDRIIVQSELDRQRIKSKKAFVWSFHEDISNISTDVKTTIPYKDYFFCAQQGWRHKRIDRLIDFFCKNTEFNLVLCGYMIDPKDKVYTKLLKKKLEKLPNNIKYLGQVDYIELIWLMKNSKGVINISLYEGWNTQVEEAMSVNIPLVLSEIQIFRSQAPFASFIDESKFDESLKDILSRPLKTPENSLYKDRINKSMKQFANAFVIK